MNENGFNNTRATIKDVAVKANVSLSTVSRALREPDKTPAETVSLMVLPIALELKVT